jgi:PAS domain S-box-containing protein
MNSGCLHLLIVDDEEAHIEAIRRAFSATGLETDIRVADSLSAYRNCIAVQPPDLVLIDLNLPDGRAVEVLTAPAEEGPFPVLVMTAFGNQEIVVEVMKAGAMDYVVKSPATFATMPRTVEQALREWKLIQSNRRAEEALRESQIFLTESQNIAGMGSYRLNFSTGFWSSSSELNKLFGIGSTYERSVEGWEALIHPDDLAMMRDYFVNEIIGKRLNFNREYRIVRLNDRVERWVHGIGKLEFDGQGRSLGMIGVIQDITERKLKEHKFRQLSRAVEQSPNVIMITDTQGDIQYVNPKFTAITGYSYDEAMGKNPRILKSEETPPETYKELWRTITTGGEWRGEFHNRRKNGELFWESASISPITDEKGAITHFLAVKEDITEHKQLTEQFLRAQRVENLGRLASGVAHDLNNILAPIMMASSMLNDDLPPQTHHQLVTTIHEAAQRGADIVKQVLTFARGVEGQKSNLNPKLLVAQVEKILRETFPKSISLSISLPEDLWTITGDVTQMHQVLLNLCVNARDAMMPKGGTLVINAENIEIDENYAAMANGAKPGRYVVMKVIDSGGGIPPAIIDNIFDPFFTTKELGKGTGLGLSTVVGIVKSHGGFVNVESELGRGSVFRVFIPAVFESEPEVAQAELPAVPGGNGETILLVDDEPEILKIAGMVLTQNGYVVVNACDGIEALTLYVQNQEVIEVVVTDVVMPVMNGLNLARALRRINPRVRIIAASGHAEESHEHELNALGVQTLLRKPFNNHQLLEAVHNAIGVKSADGAEI